MLACSRTLLVLVSVLILSACDNMSNFIDARSLTCGAAEGGWRDLSWVRIQDEQSQILNLNRLPFSVVDVQLKPIPSELYQLSSKGCLGVPRDQSFVVRLPGRKALFTRLTINPSPLQYLVAQTREKALDLSILPARKFYQGQSQLRVSSSEPSRIRLCLERVGHTPCLPVNDLNIAVSGQLFQDLRDVIELPNAEGAYRLFLLSETIDGTLGLTSFDFAIDNTAPKVIPDFEERFPARSYFGKPTFFMDAGYPIKFLSLNDSLAATRIEYCLVSADSAVDSCLQPVVYGDENPLTLPPGSSKLIVRASDQAGNGANEPWRVLSLIARTSCSSAEFLQSLADGRPLDCQILDGDLDLTLLQPQLFPLLDRFVEVTGRIVFTSETATSVPLFKNLYSAVGIDFNLGAEQAQDFVAFPQLHELQDLSLRLSMGGKSIVSFNAIRQMLRVNLANIENVKELKIFASLQFIDDALWIYTLDTVKDLGFLSSLERAGNLRIRLCDELTDLKALKNLRSVNTLEITDNPKLASLEGLEGIPYLEKLTLNGLAIRDFKGLEGLKEITFGLFVQGNASLISIKGLQNLQKVSYFLFRDNENLPEGLDILGEPIEQ